MSFAKQKHQLFWPLYLVILLFLLQESTEATNRTRVSVMSYNLENLFDWKHDEGKNDLTYLPLSQKQGPAHRYVCGQIKRNVWRKQCLEYDWSEKVARSKMQQLAKVILSVNEGRGPDILIVQEIENNHILNIFNREYLFKAGYQTKVLLEGRDRRGIDVALLSRLPKVGEEKLHYIPFKSIQKKQFEDTRPILEVPLRLSNGKILHVFGVHLPAPFHPWKLRRESLDFLNNLASGIPEGAMAIAGGDFNVPSDEEKKRSLFRDTASLGWKVSFYEGCRTCEGTYYYPPLKQWSFLDVLLFSKKSKSGWSLDAESIKVIKNDFQLNRKGFPKSFDPKTNSGASDHLPIYAEVY